MSGEGYRIQGTDQSVYILYVGKNNHTCITLNNRGEFYVTGTCDNTIPIFRYFPENEKTMLVRSNIPIFTQNAHLLNEAQLNAIKLFF